MKRAILSDIHGNLEALNAVLADIKSQDISQIYCLGDVIGYGPNPLDCLDLAMKFDVCLLGNHDQAVLVDPECFSSGAQRSVFWTREQLRNACEHSSARQASLGFLEEMPRIHREDGIVFVHGSVRDPLNEYVFPEDVYDTGKLKRIFAMIQRHCFQGHTHVPGIFTAGAQFHSAVEVGSGFRLGQEKTMINVGSVGQPRDSDSRACYAVLDEDVVTFQRVPYPVELTVEKIHSIAQLDDFLGDRLIEGR